MNTKQIIIVSISAIVALVLSMVLIAGSIALHNTDRDMHGHYRTVDLGAYKR
jgi:hypothetical protein